MDCRKIWESIDKGADELLKNDISENMKLNMIQAINERVEQMHKDLDAKGEEFMNRIIGSFKDQQEEIAKDGETKKLSRSEQKEKELREKRLAEIQSITNEIEKDYQIQMDQLKEALEKVIRRTSVIDSSVLLFKSTEISKLLTIGKDDFKIKLPREIGGLLKGKSNFELTWDTLRNNAICSIVDKDDSSKLNVKGTTCYTYYQTTQKLKDEDVTIEIEYKIDGSDNYWYMGVINELVLTPSTCMCCTIANGFYIHPNGDIVLNAKRENIPKLKADLGKIHNVTFKLALSNKEMFIIIDDQDEVGPYQLFGNTFCFTAGSCNSKNGYIKILNAYYG